VSATTSTQVSWKSAERDQASRQDMYLWLLKLQLGVMHWETAYPASQDRRREEAASPILPGDAFDLWPFGDDQEFTGQPEVDWFGPGEPW
jgi:hypothetical protein